MNRSLLSLPGLSLLAAGLLFAPAAHAQTTLDFEGVPNTYLFQSGDQNLDGYYPGVTFGPGVTILDAARGGYNSGGYPPHSGTAVAFSGDDALIDIVFDTPSLGGASFYYSADVGGLAIATLADGSIEPVALDPNYGSSSLVSFAGDVKSIEISQTPSYFTFDDLTFTPNETSVPEPGSVALLVGIGLSGTGFLIRRRK